MKNICVVLLVAVIGAVTSASLNSYNKTQQKSNSLLAGIIGGANASIKEFKFLTTVHLLKSLPEALFIYGSGIIINKEWVLTSSLITDGAFPRQLKVRVGSEHALTGGKELNVSKIMLHPKRREYPTEYSIALLKLSEQLEYSESVGPVKFATSLPENGASSVVAGIGASLLDLTGNPRLRKADVSFLDNKSCKTIDPNFVKNTSICAASTTNDGPSYYDWGSPLLHNGELIGSYVINANNDIKSPGIYVDVTENGKLKKWIDTQINY